MPKVVSVILVHADIAKVLTECEKLRVGLPDQRLQRYRVNQPLTATVGSRISRAAEARLNALYMDHVSKGE
jgi:hypothetical protein